MRHRLLPLTLALAIAAPALCQTDAAKQPPAGAAASVRMVEVNDPAMHMRAGAMLIPADWKFAGTIYRERGCHGNGAQTKWIAQAADGETAIEFYPGSGWRDTQSEQMAHIMANGGCPPVSITKGATFLKEVVLPQMRPSATIDSIDPLNEGDQEYLKENLKHLQDQADDAARKSMQMGLRKVFRPDLHQLDGATAHIHYTLNGQVVEETVTTVVHCFDVFVPPTFVSQASANRNCNSYPIVVMRAPQGKLEAMRPELLAIQHSYRVDKAWDFAMAQQIQQQSQRMLADSQAQFNATMAASQAAFEARTAEWRANEAARQISVDRSIAESRAQQNAMDIQAHRWALYAGDKQVMMDPSTGLQYEVSNKFGNSYVSQDGSQIIQSTTPVDPYDANTGQPYRRLEPH